MSLAELQAWLIGDGIGEEIELLTKMTVRSEFSGLVEEDGPNSEDFDWQRLILAGSILARSGRRGDQEAALRIAVAAVSMVEDARVRDGGAVLLGKLSNFRSITLATDRGLVADGLEERLGVSLRL